jgi:hypothetical protein
MFILFDWYELSHSIYKKKKLQERVDPHSLYFYEEIFFFVMV